jgi:hypothetical protein
MSCTPSTCIGGTCNPTITTQCDCPPNWTRQFSIVKVDCSTVTYLKEIAFALSLAIHCFGVIHTFFLLVPRAKGATLNVAKSMIACHCSAAGLAIATFIEGEWYVACIFFLGCYFMCIWLITYFAIILFLVPTISMKLSKQREYTFKFQVTIGIVIAGNWMVFIAAMYEAVMGDVEKLNYVLMSVYAYVFVTAIVLVSACLIGVRQLLIALKGGQVSDSSSSGGSPTTISVRHRNNQIDEEQQQLTAPTQHHHSVQSANTSRATAIQRLETIRQVLIGVNVVIFMPAAYVVYFYVTLTAPGFDYFMAIFFITYPLAQLFTMRQMLPKSSNSSNTGGDMNNVNTNNSVVNRQVVSNDHTTNHQQGVRSDGE